MKRKSAVLIVSILLVCALLSFTACKDQKIINYGNGYSEYEGVYLTIESIDESEGNATLNVKWHNETDYKFSYGAPYTIERKAGNEWESVNIAAVQFIDVIYWLSPHDVCEWSYTTEFWDISKEGVYRLRSWFNLQEENISQSYQVWVEFEVRSFANTDRHKVTMKYEDWLYEELKDSYKTGEEVVVKIGMATDLGYMLLVNGERVAQDEWNGEEYWQFTFIMPDEDVVIEFKTYDGFLQYPNEAELIETYMLKNPQAGSARVCNYYGEYASGAVVAMMEAEEEGYTDAEWAENISRFNIRYNNGNRILVLYQGAFYTLTKAYENGYLTNADMAKIENKQREFFPYLY